MKNDVVNLVSFVKKGLMGGLFGGLLVGGLFVVFFGGVFEGI